MVGAGGANVSCSQKPNHRMSPGGCVHASPLIFNGSRRNKGQHVAVIIIYCCRFEIISCTLRYSTPVVKSWRFNTSREFTVNHVRTSNKLCYCANPNAVCHLATVARPSDCPVHIANIGTQRQSSPQMQAEHALATSASVCSWLRPVNPWGQACVNGDGTVLATS